MGSTEIGAANPVVTISAAYGAGGGFVGRRVAEQLGVGFLDRAITAAVAEELEERPQDVEAYEDDLGSGVGYFLSHFATVGGAWGGVVPTEGDWYHDERSYKAHVADVLEKRAEQGAVILGRGAQVVLRDRRGALHVRLDGPVERRVAQAVEIAGLEQAEARRAQHRTDAARHRYFQRLYHGDVADPRHYHLVIDATSVPLTTCADVIVSVVRGRGELRSLGDLVAAEDI